MKKDKTILHRLLAADVTSELYLRFGNYRRKFINFYYTLILRFCCRYKCINLGVNVSFNGYMHFDRFKKSQISVGDDCVFNSDYHFNHLINSFCLAKTNRAGAKIIIGNNSGFSSTRLICDDYIIVGDNVTIGANTIIRDGDDHPDITGTESKGIKIGNNVFIGMNCMILKGVTIGDNVIIGAGSIVTKSISSNSIAAGVPCRVIKSRKC